MSGRVIKLILLLIVVAAVSYLFYLNPGAVTVHLSAKETWTAPMALILVATFFSGVLIAAVFSFVLGVKHSFRDWRMDQQHRKIAEHQELIEVGREQMIAGNLVEAKRCFRKVVDNDPANVIARILLAKSLQRANKLRAALKVLDESRASRKQNAELLFLAADINSELGNQTAAFDNVLLVHKADPKNDFALAKLVEFSADLNRYEQAIEYVNQRIRICAPKDRAQLQGELAEYELAYAKKQSNGDAQAVKHAVNDVLKRHRNFAPAISELAFLSREEGELESASKLWIKAYGLECDINYLERLAKTWMKVEDPSRAIASVRSALDEQRTSPLTCPEGHLFLINLLLFLRMDDEASKELTALRKSLSSKDELALQLEIVQAKLMNREDKHEEAFLALLNILEERHPGPGQRVFLEPAFDDRIHDANWSVRSKMRMATKPSPYLSIS